MADLRQCVSALTREDHHDAALEVLEHLCTIEPGDPSAKRLSLDVEPTSNWRRLYSRDTSDYGGCSIWPQASNFQEVFDMKGFILVRALAFALWSLGAVAFLACGSVDEDDAPDTCPSPLELGGTLSESLTVPETPQDCPAHQLTADLTISDGAVLTIAPGARIEARTDLFIRAAKEGALVAVGTAAKPILFTAADPVLGWMGLDLFNSNRSENRLEHVIVEFAGSSKQRYASEPASIALTSNQPSPPRAIIKNTIIRNGFGNGIELGANAIAPEFVNNTIQDNAGRAAYVQGSLAHWLDRSSTFSPNGSDEVFVKAFPGVDEEALLAKRSRTRCSCSTLSYTASR